MVLSMFFKKIMIHTRYNPVDEEYLCPKLQRKFVNTFAVIISPCTKIKKILLIAEKKCGFADDDTGRRDRFRLVYKNELYPLNEDARVCDLISYLNIKDNKIVLEIVVCLGGGKDIINIEGIRFFYHSREPKKHLPHIHAEYQNNEESIILMPEEEPPRIIGSLKNKKKEKIAINFAKEHRKKLIENYDKFQNGIQINSFFVDDNGLICEE